MYWIGSSNQQNEEKSFDDFLVKFVAEKYRG